MTDQQPAPAKPAPKPDPAQILHAKLGFPPAVARAYVEKLSDEQRQSLITAGSITLNADQAVLRLIDRWQDEKDAAEKAAKDAKAAAPPSTPPS